MGEGCLSYTYCPTIDVVVSCCFVRDHFKRKVHTNVFGYCPSPTIPCISLFLQSQGYQQIVCLSVALGKHFLLPIPTDPSLPLLSPRPGTELRTTTGFWVNASVLDGGGDADFESWFFSLFQINTSCIPAQPSELVRLCLSVYFLPFSCCVFTQCISSDFSSYFLHRYQQDLFASHWFNHWLLPF